MLWRTSYAFTQAQTISSSADAEQTTSSRLALLLQRIVVERSPVRGFAADRPLSQRLGSHPAPSVCFFPLSPPSRLSLFHLCVVAHTALGSPSNSVCSRMDFHHTLHGSCLSVEGFAYPCDFAPGLSFPYPSSRLITPHTATPAPIAVTTVFNPVTAVVKNAIINPFCNKTGL